MQKINWYVGHMAKSLNLMEKQLDKVDLVIQILDARCPNISSNPELVKLCNNKPIINIALKSDLADLSSKQQDVNYLSIAQKNFVNKVEKIIQEKLADKIKKYKTKGLVNPHFYIMVVGQWGIDGKVHVSFHEEDIVPEVFKRIQVRTVF